MRCRGGLWRGRSGLLTFSCRSMRLSICFEVCAHVLCGLRFTGVSQQCYTTSIAFLQVPWRGRSKEMPQQSVVGDVTL